MKSIWNDISPQFFFQKEIYILQWFICQSKSNTNNKVLCGEMLFKMNFIFKTLQMFSSVTKQKLLRSDFIYKVCKSHKNVVKILRHQSEGNGEFNLRRRKLWSTSGLKCNKLCCKVCYLRCDRGKTKRLVKTWP